MLIMYLLDYVFDQLQQILPRVRRLFCCGTRWARTPYRPDGTYDQLSRPLDHEDV